MQAKNKFNKFKLNNLATSMKLKALYPSRFTHNLYKNDKGILEPCVIINKSKNGFHIKLHNSKISIFLKNGTKRLLPFHPNRENKHHMKIPINSIIDHVDEITHSELDDNIFFDHPNHEILTMQSTCTANLNPIKCKQQMQITHPYEKLVTVFSDTGANLNCINADIAKQYQQYLCKAPRPFTVRTADNYVNCQSYIPLKITAQVMDTNAPHNTDKVSMKTVNVIAKFYVLPNLAHNYLIGRRLQAAIGIYHGPAHELINDYIHKAKLTDDWGLHDKFEYPLAPGLFPLHKNDPEDNDIINNIKIKNKECELFIKQLLRDHKSNLATHEMDSGRIKANPFTIEFKENVNTEPVYCKEYPIKREYKREIQRQIDELLKHGFIEHAKNSPWRFPIFCVPKKTGDVRIVFDFRKLNAMTKLNKYPIPNAIHQMHKFKGANYITSLDIKGGYWHIPVRESDQEKLTFVFGNRSYKWKVLPFGPTNAPSHFQFTMTKIFKEFIDEKWLVVYLDDISIISKTLSEHKNHLRRVFEVLRKNDIRLRLDKCIWAVPETEYLGFLINKHGITPTEKYKNKILKCEVPKERKHVQCFLGMINWLHRFIPNLHLLIHPLVDLTHKNKPWQWGEKEHNAFHQLKKVIEEPKFLYHPDDKKIFHLFCDASEKGIGALLAQHDPETGLYNPVEFGSKLFNPTQQNWHVSEKEIFAVVHFTEKWRYLLMNDEFVIHTDHLNLQELFNRAKNFKAGKLYRWAVRLQDYSFRCKYLPGTKNCFADYLSRHTTPVETVMKGINIESDEDGDPVLTVLSRVKTASKSSDSKTNLNPVDPMSTLPRNPDILKTYSDFLLTEYIKTNCNYQIDQVIYDQDDKMQDVTYPRHMCYINEVSNNSPNPRQPIIGPNNNYRINQMNNNSNPNNEIPPKDDASDRTDPNIPNNGYKFTKPSNYAHAARKRTNEILAEQPNGELIIPIPSFPKVPLAPPPKEQEQPINSTNSAQVSLNLPNLESFVDQENPSPIPTDNKPVPIAHTDQKAVPGKRRRLKKLISGEFFAKNDKPKESIDINTDKVKAIAKSLNNADDHNSTVLRRFAKTTESKRYNTRLENKKRYELNQNVLKELQLESTKEHNNDQSPEEHTKSDKANKKLQLLNETILKNQMRPIKHKINLSNTLILDKIVEGTLFAKNFIISKQTDDPELYAIIEYLRTKNSTLLFDITDHTYNRVLKGRYSWSKSEGLTYIQGDPDGDCKRLVVVPSYLRTMILKYFHDKFIHNGISRMKQAINLNYTWPGINKDIANYIKMCKNCIHKEKGFPKDKKTIKLFPAIKPFEMIHIDIVGPMPLTSKGNRYIVSMIDRFSRYCMLIPVPNMKAMSIIKALEKWVTIFGPPKQILSDNGSQFVSEIYKHYNETSNTKLKYTTAYHPQCNGMIERLHRWIKERLTLISVETMKDFIGGDDWCEYIPFIQWTYNTTPNHMTNHAPQEIIFGANYHNSFTNPDPSEFSAGTPAEYIDYMNNRRNLIHEDVRKYQRYYDKQRTKHHQRVTETNPRKKFEVGDLVMYYCGDQMVGNVRKLTTNWQGPFEITRISSDGLVATIVNVHNFENSFPTNIKHLKLWRPHNENLWIESPMTYMLGSINGRIEHNRFEQLCILEHKMRIKGWNKPTRDAFYEKTAVTPIEYPKIRRDICILESLLDTKTYKN